MILYFLDFNTGKSFSEAHKMTRDCSLNSPKNTISQHVVHKYCFECQNKNKKQLVYTRNCKLVFLGEFNEQSLVILWVN